MVLGNKMDRVEAKPESRAVPRERAKEFCSRAGPWLEGGEDLPHYETSAKTDANVEAAFLEAAALALLHEERRRKESKGGVMNTALTLGAYFARPYSLAKRWDM